MDNVQVLSEVKSKNSKVKKGGRLVGLHCFCSSFEFLILTFDFP